MNDRTYEDGLRDGRIDALEHMQKDHVRRMDSHEARLRILERMMWGAIAIIAFIEFWPHVSAFFN